MKHVMRLNDEPFRMIKSGRKTIELRLYDEKRRLIAVGDEIEFVHADDATEKLDCRVAALHRFSSFAELYDNLPLLQCGYTESDISTASAADMDQYYPKEKQALFGVLGIEIVLK